MLNDNSNFNRNSNIKNKKENSINNSSTNKNLGNWNRINSYNYVDNEINNECNNTRELVNIMNNYI